MAKPPKSPAALLESAWPLPLAAFLGCWAYSWAALWGNISSIADPYLYYFPQMRMAGESLGRGLLPLWNLYSACGTPFLANWQSACFYPPVFLAGMWGVNGPSPWFALFHQLLAFGGFYLWLRQRGLGRSWSLLGSLSFVGSAQAILLFGFDAIEAALAWVPGFFGSPPKPALGAAGPVGFYLLWSSPCNGRQAIPMSPSTRFFS